MISLIKKLLLVLFIYFIEYNIASLLFKLYIVFPLTFIAYSLFVYRKETTMQPIVPFSLGLLIDLLSGSYFGINAILFMLITYLINLYANAFKLFSYLQICIFFSFSATAYVGFVQLALNTNNFSYLTLLLSFIFNFVICISTALIHAYGPSSRQIKPKI